MKNLIILEDATIFLLSLYFFNQLEMDWWWYFIFILTPDVGMIGYAANKSIGAYIYNLFHHRGLAILLIFVGWHYQLHWLQFAAIILLSHSCLDRIFGFGLKYRDDFKHTHMQEL